jgi:hypothetical protein
MKLNDYIDKSIMIQILGYGDSPITARLRGVETGGIWIENQDITNQILTAAGRLQSAQTPVLFFPYSQVLFALGTIPGVALNEASLGV